MLATCLISCHTNKLYEKYPERTPRDPAWAKAIELEGVPNFYKVSDDLYRSAQPSAEGMRNLEKLGIKTVVNLRAFHSDSRKLEGTHLQYKRIYMKNWHPEMEDIARFFKVMLDSRNTPVLIHCEQGADRTGMIAAMYRVLVQGWSQEEALEEMKWGGFGAHKIWIHLPPWIKNLDIDELKEEIQEEIKDD